jgi:hypothetical protein
MQKGDILVSSWGYGQTNIDFYKVVDVTAKSVKIVRLGEIITERDSAMSEYVIPNENEIRGQVMTKRIKVRRANDSTYVKISDYAIASKWGGHPEFQSHWH